MSRTYYRYKYGKPPVKLGFFAALKRRMKGRTFINLSRPKPKIATPNNG